jgi:hypothetical protein
MKSCVNQRICCEVIETVNDIRPTATMSLKDEDDISNPDQIWARGVWSHGVILPTIGSVVCTRTRLSL